MAEARYSQDEFTCPVCLDLLKDPVTIQCGHSYCKSCITDCWDQEDQKRVYSCPQCRHTFSPRPALARNTMLAEVTEKLKKRKRPADCDAEAHIKYKAVKSCLMCLNSYCQNHLEQHESWFRAKRHNLIEATGRLQEMICQKHRSAQTAVEDSERIFTELIRSIERSRSELIRLIRDQEKTAVSRAEERLELLEQEINDLRRRDAELEQIIVDLNSHQLTLDLNTVNKHLHLSESNRVITVTYTVQSYPDHPDRFDHYRQVLCRESVCGRCYWELQWSGNYGVRISVSYKSISRKEGVECLFGSNDQSWSLICFPSRYSFWHSNIYTDLPVESISSRIGVFVDHSAGTLSFYSVSDTMSLIHTVQTTFTQPLYPGIGLGSGSSQRLT
uniref:Tripartite motif-containing protein 16-like n=1 Tax=Cyprinus carpio TaxID=7962 RepID=A0A8C1V6T5_CYPCA